MRRLLALSALLFLLASCGQSFGRRTTATPEPVASTKVGQGIVFITPTPGAPTNEPGTSARPSSVAGFVIRLRDQNNNRPQGIPVRFEGPVRRVVNSDSSGAARLTGPAGRYTMRIDIGCHSAVLVERGASGTVHTVAGQTRDAEVEVRWRHRFAPSGSSTSDAAGDWPVGRPVRLNYDVVDRCKDDLAPNAALPTFFFQPGPNVKVIGTPSMRADGGGRGHVSVQCTRAGDAQLYLTDRANPPDRVDLVGSTTSYAGRPRCSRT